MVYGPCGGVQADGRCEMRPIPCAFPELVAFAGPPRSRPPVKAPRVLTDLSAPPADAAALIATARMLAGSCDAVLVGDHQDRPDFPPTMLARMLAATGLAPWVTLACRDRNRVVLEQELRGLAAGGDAAAVLCVTGDGRAYDVRPEITQVFDLDGTRLAALAAEHDLLVAVPETPGARPTELRAARLVEKQRAGANVAVLNHAGSVAAVAAFMARARSLGLVIPVLAAVAVFTDERSAAVLAGLPGLDLDGEMVHRVLSARDPVAAGIDAAIDQARALLAVEGVAGVNLSGMASDRGTGFAAEVQAEIGRRLAPDEHT